MNSQKPNALYGESLFTTSRAKGSKMFFHQAHIQRLKTGIESYYLGRELSHKELESLEESVFSILNKIHKDERQGETESRLRISISAPARDNLFSREFQFEELEFSYQLAPLSVGLEEPVSLKSFPSPFSSYYPNLKMGSYMPLLFLKMKAARAGYGEALLYSSSDAGPLALEATTSNIFFYKGKNIFTPQSFILEGVIKKALEKSFDVEKRDIPLAALGEYDGAFLTNSASIIREVKKVDNLEFSQLNESPVQDILEELLKRGYRESQI